MRSAEGYLLLDAHKDWKLGDKRLDIVVGGNLVGVGQQRVHLNKRTNKEKRYERNT